MENNQEEKSFEELVEQSMRKIGIGQIVEGTIIEISKDNEIFVDIGYKADGIIPLSEYSYNEKANPRNDFNIGDTISAEVVKLNDGIGNVLLSCKKLKSVELKKEFEEKIKNDEIFEGKISNVSEKGLIINYSGIRIFIPLSLAGIPRQENINTYLGKNIRFKIIESDFEKRRIIGSAKVLLDEERQKIMRDFWDNVAIGKEYVGKVSSISSYGAFVDIGGIQGLLHVSELSWSKNISAKDILTQGQEVKVLIKEFDKENKRISLSSVNKGPNPWDNIRDKYHVGDIVEVKVVSLKPFGAFVELETGIEGLVHISQITESRINKPDEKLNINQIVNAKIIDINEENKKIELSIKDLEGTSKEYTE